MSVFDKEIVQYIAESLGVNIKDDAQTLLIEDAEYRLREIIHESVKFMRHSKRKQLTPRDINSALTAKNVQPLFGYTAGSPSTFKSLVLGAGAQPLYYLEDTEIDLEELINKSLPSVPLEVTFTAHWLAIEGVQPKIVQNPTLNDRIAPQESVNVNRPPGVGVTPTSTTNAPPLVKQVLTQELQLYYEKITETIKNPQLQKVAIESLSSDPGIQALMPYFVTFISDTLHQILPAIITCVVAKNLSLPHEDHYALRRHASSLLKHITDKCGSTYQGLQARITKTLLRALLDPTKPFTTLYGAMYALIAMGPEVVHLLIAPHASDIGTRLHADIEDEEGVAIARDRCMELMISTLVKHFETQVEGDYEKAQNALRETYGVFADRVFELSGPSDVDMQ